MVFLYVFAAMAGVANAFQAGSNAVLSKATNQPFLAAILVFGIGAGTVALAGLVAGRLGPPAPLAAVPWWGWLGGLFAAVLLMSQLFVATSIGAGPYLGIVVVTGTIASLAIDHFGLVGFEVHRLGPGRAIGGALMALGVLLVALF